MERWAETVDGQYVNLTRTAILSIRQTGSDEWSVMADHHQLLPLYASEGEARDALRLLASSDPVKGNVVPPFEAGESHKPKKRTK